MSVRRVHTLYLRRRRARRRPDNPAKKKKRRRRLNARLDVFRRFDASARQRGGRAFCVALGAVRYNSNSEGVGGSRERARLCSRVIGLTTCLAAVLRRPSPLPSPFSTPRRPYARPHGGLRDEEPPDSPPAGCVRPPRHGAPLALPSLPPPRNLWPLTMASLSRVAAHVETEWVYGAMGRCSHGWLPRHCDEHRRVASMSGRSVACARDAIAPHHPPLPPESKPDPLPSCSPLSCAPRWPAGFFLVLVGGA